MNAQQLEKLFERRVQKIRDTIITKAKEYAPDDTDRLSNFRRAGAAKGESPEKALWGMAIKHYLSVVDIIDTVSKGVVPRRDHIDEKIGDLITYLILLEALVVDRAEFRDDYKVHTKKRVLSLVDFINSSYVNGDIVYAVLSSTAIRELSKEKDYEPMAHPKYCGQFKDIFITCDLNQSTEVVVYFEK